MAWTGEKPTEEVSMRVRISVLNERPDLRDGWRKGGESVGKPPNERVAISFGSALKHFLFQSGIEEGVDGRPGRLAGNGRFLGGRRDHSMGVPASAGLTRPRPRSRMRKRFN